MLSRILSSGGLRNPFRLAAADTAPSTWSNLRQMHFVGLQFLLSTGKISPLSLVNHMLQQPNACHAFTRYKYNNEISKTERSANPLPLQDIPFSLHDATYGHGPSLENYVLDKLVKQAKGILIGYNNCGVHLGNKLVHPMDPNFRVGTSGCPVGVFTGG